MSHYTITLDIEADSTELAIAHAAQVLGDIVPEHVLTYVREVEAGVEFGILTNSYAHGELDLQEIRRFESVVTAHRRGVARGRATA